MWWYDGRFMDLRRPLDSSPARQEYLRAWFSEMERREAEGLIPPKLAPCPPHCDHSGPNRENAFAVGSDMTAGDLAEIMDVPEGFLYGDEGATYD